MTTDLTREQAREQIARAIYGAYRSDLTTEDAANAWEDMGESPLRDDIEHDADAALSVLWPEVERLTRERDEARENVVDAVALVERMAAEGCGCVSVPDFTPGRAPQSTRTLPGRAGSSTVASRERDDEIERLRAELAHAHTVIARHVEPRRTNPKPCHSHVTREIRPGCPACDRIMETWTIARLEGW